MPVGVRALTAVARPDSHGNGGRRFESVRGLCKVPARQLICVQVDLADSAACGGYGAAYGAFRLQTPPTAASEDASYELTSHHRAIVDELMCSDEPDAPPRLLAPLDVGDRLPWKLDRNRESRWLTVIEVDRYQLYGAFVEPRGCNRRRRVANAAGAEATKTSQTVAVACVQLPIEAHGKEGRSFIGRRQFVRA